MTTKGAVVSWFNLNRIRKHKPSTYLKLLWANVYKRRLRARRALKSKQGCAFRQKFCCLWSWLLYLLQGST
jgi:hypothetical protein